MTVVSSCKNDHVVKGRRVILHIGLPKTATTFLQYSIFKHQDEIVYIHDPVHGSLEKLLKRHQRADMNDLQELEKKIIEELPDENVLVSNENISLNAREPWLGEGPTPESFCERLLRITRQLGRVYVLLGIRRQDQWLASRYAESSKLFPEFSQEDFERRMYHLFGEPLRGAMQWLDYEKTYSMLVEHFGPDKVLLIPSEALVASDVKNTLHRLERFLGCPGLAMECMTRPEIIKKRNTLSMGNNLWVMRGKDDVNLSLSDQLGNKIIRRFCVGNKIVGKAINWDLRRYGYF